MEGGGLRSDEQEWLVIIGVVLASVISILFFLLWFGFVGAKCYSESNGVITEIPC